MERCQTTGQLFKILKNLQKDHVDTGGHRFQNCTFSSALQCPVCPSVGNMTGMMLTFLFSHFLAGLHFWFRLLDLRDYLFQLPSGCGLSPRSYFLQPLQQQQK